MATFRNAVERIDWDFKAEEIPHASGEGFAEGKGPMPEPSDEQVDGFLQNLRKIADDFDIKTLDDIDPGMYPKMRAASTKMLVEVGVPEEQLEQLPPRYFDAFRNFIVDELTPEGGSVV